MNMEMIVAFLTNPIPPDSFIYRQRENTSRDNRLELRPGGTRATSRTSPYEEKIGGWGGEEGERRGGRQVTIRYISLHLRLQLNPTSSTQYAPDIGVVS